jgi:citrate lyase beta subunit
MKAAGGAIGSPKIAADAIAAVEAAEEMVKERWPTQSDRDRDYQMVKDKLRPLLAGTSREERLDDITETVMGLALAKEIEDGKQCSLDTALAIVMGFYARHLGGDAADRH